MIPLITRDELKAAIEAARRGLLTFGTGAGAAAC